MYRCGRCLLVLFLPLLLGISSCHKGRSDADISDFKLLQPFVYYGVNDTLPGDAIGDVNWIPLEFSEINPMHDITDLYVADSVLVVCCRHQGLVQVYDDKGKFHYNISQLGAGPQEYLEIAAMTATSTSIYIVDNFSKSVLRYSIADGSFLSRESLPFIAWDIAAFNDSVFLFTCMRNNPDAAAPNASLNYAVWKTDAQFNIMQTYLPLDEGYVEIYGKKKYFTKHNDDIFFHTFLYDGFFIFSSDGSLAFCPVKVPKPFKGDKAQLTFKDAVEHGYDYLSSTPYVTDNFSVMEISRGNISTELFANNRDREIYSNSQDWARNIPVNIIGSIDNDFIGYLIDDEDMYDNLVAYGFPKANAATEEIIRRGGCVLIRYIMK